MTRLPLRIAFRTDASVQIGTGHVMRCLTLADELTRQGHECWFVCREHEGHLGKLIESKGHGLITLSTLTPDESLCESDSSENYTGWLGVTWEKDASQTLDAIGLLKLDRLVVDHYALDAQWERMLANAVDRIMVVDDLANRPHECALLLDQNLGRAASDYDGLLPPDCQRLIGPRYALLRPEFLEYRARSLKRRQHPVLRRILISLGGVDRTNVTGRVLDALSASALPASTELDIIMGSDAPFLDQVRKQAARLPFEATVSASVKDVAERMYRADLAIGAAGSTSWERCCLGLPALVMVLAENQKRSANALSLHGVALVAETVDEVAIVLERFSSGTQLLSGLSLMSSAGAELVDGGGSQRVVRNFSD